MSYGQYSQNPYHQGPAQEAGGYQQGSQYGQGYEMQNYSTPAQPSTLSQGDFLKRVTEVRKEIDALNEQVNNLANLQREALQPNAQGNPQALVDREVANIQAHNVRVKDEIKSLEQDLANTTDSSRNTKKTQVESLKTAFSSSLKAFQSAENDAIQAYRSQIAHQYRIVNPDASDAEVQEAANADWGSEGVFQTALRSSRTGQASSLLGNVRARHNELQRIEQTLVELARIFEDLNTVVAQQDYAVQAAEINAEETTANMDHGIKETDKAKESAARARRLKWWCALVVVLIILAIALGVGLGIGIGQNAGK